MLICRFRLGCPADMGWHMGPDNHSVGPGVFEEGERGME